MVGAPDVDQVIEAAAELLGHIADGGREVGRTAVRPVDAAILVVAELGRAGLRGTVLLVDVPVLPQPLDRAIYPAYVVQAGLARPHIEVHAEALEAGLDTFPNPPRGPVPDQCA